MSDDILRVYIGWDQREEEAARICHASMVRRSSLPVHMTPIKLSWLIYMGWYKRTWVRDAEGRMVDNGDGKPFSTEFAFSRFLVPFLEHYRGWALFCDCDFLFKADPAELFALADDRYAVMAVQHDHRPAETVKMDGQAQQHYRRKNWSSLVLWNCGHPANAALTKEVVSEKPGSWLHGFEWLKDEEIGALPIEWNWLEGWSDPSVTPKAVHYTRGGPWFSDYQGVAYADDWRRERRVIDESMVIGGEGKVAAKLFSQPHRPFLRRVAAE